MLQEEVSRYRNIDFYARQVVEGFLTGRHKSPFHGFSAEFADYRLYNSGESTRHIDWRLYGRTDKLFVKRFEDETNLRCHLVIDNSTSMLFPVERHADVEHPNKLTFSVYAAAVLTELLLRQRDAFGLTLLSDGIDLDTPCRASAAHQRHLFSLLEPLLAPLPSTPPQRPTSMAAALHLLAEQWRRRSLVILFTDALLRPDEREPLFDALRHLRHNHHEIILFHTLDVAREVQLGYGSRPVRFVDLESGLELKAQPESIAADYRRRTEALVDDLKRHSLQYRIDYVAVDVEQGFHPVMLPFLLKRARSG